MAVWFSINRHIADLGRAAHICGAAYGLNYAQQVNSVKLRVPPSVEERIDWQANTLFDDR
ncbi:hypothetical protein SAMN05518866_108104 [Sphingobium sp. YR768]|nr:hypothetical protein SAMN05518866_108104 [Sphingobium sp. YR768]